MTLHYIEVTGQVTSDKGCTGGSLLSSMDAKDPSQQPPRLYLKLPNLLSPTLGDLAGELGSSSGNLPTDRGLGTWL